MRLRARTLMWILWPAFMAAAAGSALVFALVDPLDVAVLGQAVTGRMGFYSVFFLLSWAVTAGACALTAWLLPTREPDEKDEG